MKLLGIFYTHNKLHPALLSQVVDRIKEAANYSNLKGINQVELIACPWEVIPGWDREQHISFLRGGAPGHLNIACQILRMLYLKKDAGFEFAVQLEHDVLYAANYFERIAQCYHEAVTNNQDPATNRCPERWVKLWTGQEQSPIVGVSSLDYIGMNETGFCQVKERHEPLSMISMRMDYAIQNYERAVRECIMQGWCYLEPHDKTGFIHIPFENKIPNVHVNMNTSGLQNHHFTNHHSVCYFPDSQGVTKHEYWGDFNDLKIFEGVSKV